MLQYIVTLHPSVIKQDLMHHTSKDDKEQINDNKKMMEHVSFKHNTYITLKNLNIKICLSGSQEVNLIFSTCTDRWLLNNRIISSSFYFRFATSATLLLFCFALLLI